MDEYNLHYYIARWDKSDPGGLEFYKGDIWGIKVGLNWVVIHIQVYVFMTIDCFNFIKIAFFQFSCLFSPLRNGFLKVIVVRLSFS